MGEVIFDKNVKISTICTKKCPNIFARVFSMSIVNQFKLYNFICLCVANIHCPYPYHLAIGLLPQ